jgi:hypothetical protein
VVCVAAAAVCGKAAAMLYRCSWVGGGLVWGGVGRGLGVGGGMVTAAEALEAFEAAATLEPSCADVSGRERESGVRGLGWT